MKAKLVNGSIDIVNDIQYNKNILDAYQNSINREGVSDRVIEYIQAKENKTAEEESLLKLRERIDAEYHAASQKYLDYKNYVEVDFDGESPSELDILMPYFEQDATTVYRKFKVVKNDPYKIKKKIEELQQKLSGSDYKIAKAYEAQLLGDAAPYENINEIIIERKSWRNKINELEKLLES